MKVVPKLITGIFKLLLDRGPYNIETSPLVWTGLEWVPYDRDLRH